MFKQELLNKIVEPLETAQDTLLSNIINRYESLTANNPNTYYRYKYLILPHSKAIKEGNSPLILSKEEMASLNAEIEFYIQEQTQVNQLICYLRRIFNNADSITTVKQCIPEYLHYLINIEIFTGPETVDSLKIVELYELLEEAPLKNTLLGV